MYSSCVPCVLLTYESHYKKKNTKKLPKKKVKIKNKIQKYKIKRFYNASLFSFVKQLHHHNN
jgi:hypothetical protein